MHLIQTALLFDCQDTRFCKLVHSLPDSLTDKTRQWSNQRFGHMSLESNDVMITYYDAEFVYRK